MTQEGATCKGSMVLGFGVRAGCKAEPQKLFPKLLCICNQNQPPMAPNFEQILIFMWSLGPLNYSFLNLGERS